MLSYEVEFYSFDVIPACPESFFPGTLQSTTIPDKRE